MSKKTSGPGKAKKGDRHASKTKKRERARPLNDHPVHSYLFSYPPSLSFNFSPLPLAPLSNPYLSFFLPPDFSSVRWVPSGPLSVIAFLNSMLVALRVANREKIFPTHRGGGRRVNRLSGRKKRGGGGRRDLFSHSSAHLSFPLPPTLSSILLLLLPQLFFRHSPLLRPATPFSSPIFFISKKEKKRRKKVFFSSYLFFLPLIINLSSFSSHFLSLLPSFFPSLLILPPPPPHI